MCAHKLYSLKILSHFFLKILISISQHDNMYDALRKLSLTFLICRNPPIETRFLKRCIASNEYRVFRSRIRKAMNNIENVYLID